LTGTAAALVAASLLLGGCTSPSTPTAETPAESASPSETPTPTAEPITKAPLTGVEIEPGTDLNASIASKIDNHIAARPQVGLQHTDLVYEELVEGGLTRYVAVWQSDIPKLYGPVRSIRGMDPAIVSSLGGIITYSGGQPVFVRRIKATDVVNVSHDEYGADESIFYRTGDKAAPHNVIAKGQNILEKFGEGVEAPSQQFPFADDLATATASFAGTPTSKIEANFSQASSPSWKWSEDKQVWLRFQTGGAKDVDDEGKQLRAVNVLTVHVETEVQAHTPVSILIGTGEASVSSGGKTIKGTWEKKSKKGKLRIYDETGVPILLAPGNSWIELVADAGTVKFKE
jgi:hypothetical protein